MDINNVSLWFAKNQKNEIITIDKYNKDDKYICPLCGSEVIAKALESDKMSPHFAHIDRSKCSGESIIHYWVKNELIKKDDVIEVITNQSKQHMIKEIAFEQSYDTPYGVYKPDITLITYKDEMVFVEVNYTNKKDTKDYYLKWNNLKNTVLEFSIKNVYSDDGTKVVLSNSFKAIYYDGIEININKGDKEYISFINRIKINSEKIKEIEWFIDDIYKYSQIKCIDIKELAIGFSELLKDKDNYMILEYLYRNSRCQDSIKDIIKFKDKYCKGICEKISQSILVKNCAISKEFSDERLIYDRIFSKYIIEISKDKIAKAFFKDTSLFYFREFEDSIKIDMTYMDVDALEMSVVKVEELKADIRKEYEKRSSIKSFIKLHAQYKYPNVKFYGHKNIKYMSFEYGRANFIIYREGTISINDLNICHVDVNTEEELKKGIEFALSYSCGNNHIISKNMVDIYFKISNIYNETNKKYEIRLNRYYINISTVCGYEICNIEYDKNTNCNEVLNIFSNAVRSYLYPVKEEITNGY